jgi:hypothetical protein
VLETERRIVEPSHNARKSRMKGALCEAGLTDRKACEGTRTGKGLLYGYWSPLLMACRL